MPTLHYRGTTTIPLEAECITPERLAGLSVAEIERLPLQQGNTSVPLAEFFSVRSGPEGEEIHIEGDCARVKWLGTGMTRGRLIVHGNAGMHVGAEMRGGEIHVHGNAADWAGAEMRGGLLHIRGNVGNLAGAAYRGAPVGMRGGTLLVEGHAGNEVGAHQRRGLIAIGKDTGDFAGVGMIAGTILVFGTLGQRAGAGMKRGTIAVFGGRPVPLPTFHLACEYQPTFLALYLKQLRELGFPVPRDVPSLVRRYCGDVVALGKGELLDCGGGN